MKAKRAIPWAIGGLALLTVSCGQGYDIAMGPLSGRIGGQPWTVATAKTESPVPTNGDLFVAMYPDTFDACTGTTAGGNRLLLGVPTTPGDYALSSDLSATFYVANGNQNLVTPYGRLKVDVVTANAIAGGANVELDDDNSVSGQFQLTICP